MLMVKTNFASIIHIIYTEMENKYLQLSWAHNFPGFGIT